MRAFVIVICCALAVNAIPARNAKLGFSLGGLGLGIGGGAGGAAGAAAGKYYPSTMTNEMMEN